VPSRPKPKGGRRFRQPPGVAIRMLARPGDGRMIVAAGMVSRTGKGLRNRAFQRPLSARWPVTGTGRFRRTAIPPRCPCDPFMPRGTPASRSGRRSTRSPGGHVARPPRVGSVARRPRSRRGCGCIFPTAPESVGDPLQPAPPGPKTGFASMAFGPARCPKASAPARSPVIPRTGRAMPLDACPFRSRKAMRASRLRFPGVASPSRSKRFPEGT
jgi:hypothetical protein